MRELCSDMFYSASSSRQSIVCVTSRTYRYQTGLPEVPLLISRLLFAFLLHANGPDVVPLYRSRPSLYSTPMSRRRVCYYTKIPINSTSDSSSCTPGAVNSLHMSAVDILFTCSLPLAEAEVGDDDGSHATDSHDSILHACDTSYFSSQP